MFFTKFSQYDTYDDFQVMMGLGDVDCNKHNLSHSYDSMICGRALTHVELRDNGNETVRKGRLRPSCRDSESGLVL